MSEWSRSCEAEGRFSHVGSMHISMKYLTATFSTRSSAAGGLPCHQGCRVQGLGLRV
jgi:hypothetical protein